MLYLFIGMCVGAVVLDFAMQNTTVVQIALFPWHFAAPLSVVILISVAVGLCIALLAMLPSAVRHELDAFAARREARRQAAYEASNSTSANVTA